RRIHQDRARYLSCGPAYLDYRIREKWLSDNIICGHGISMKCPQCSADPRDHFREDGPGTRAIHRFWFDGGPAPAESVIAKGTSRRRGIHLPAPGVPASLHHRQLFFFLLAEVMLLADVVIQIEKPTAEVRIHPLPRPDARSLLILLLIEALVARGWCVSLKRG